MKPVIIIGFSIAAYCCGLICTDFPTGNAEMDGP